MSVSFDSLEAKIDAAIASASASRLPRSGSSRQGLGSPGSFSLPTHTPSGTQTPVSSRPGTPSKGHAASSSLASPKATSRPAGVEAEAVNGVSAEEPKAAAAAAEEVTQPADTPAAPSASAAAMPAATPATAEPAAAAPAQDPELKRTGSANWGDDEDDLDAMMTGRASAISAGTRGPASAAQAGEDAAQEQASEAAQQAPATEAGTQEAAAEEPAAETETAAAENTTSNVPETADAPPAAAAEPPAVPEPAVPAQPAAARRVSPVNVPQPPATPTSQASMGPRRDSRRSVQSTTESQTARQRAPSAASRTGGVISARRPSGASSVQPPATPTRARATSAVTPRSTTGASVRRPSNATATSEVRSVRSVTRPAVATPSGGRVTAPTSRPSSAARTPQRTPAANRATTPTPARSTSRAQNVPSRYMQAATDRRTEPGPAALRSSSVPAPPASRYVRGQGHTRDWVDVNARASADLAAIADMEATYKSIAGETAEKPHPALAASLTVPAGDMGARARSMSRGAGHATTGALYGKGRERHPLRRSSKAAEIEDEIERARAEHLGLVVGSRVGTLTRTQAADVSQRMYERAAEQRSRVAATSAQLPSDCTFAPAISNRAAALGGRITYAVANLAPGATTPGSARSPRSGSPAGSAGGDAALPRHEFLYANAAALAMQRARAIEKAVREDTNCTFQPEITAKARALSATRRSIDGDGEHGEASSTVSERLYTLAKTAEQRRMILAEEALRQEATFAPALNPRSLAMAERPRSASVANRPQLYELSDETRPDILAARKAELELQHCTFRPQTNAGRRRPTSVGGTTPRSASRSDVPVYERLRTAGAEVSLRCEQLREQYEAKKLADYTFSPQVNKASQRIAARSRARSTDPNATATSVRSVGKSSVRSTTPQDTRERLYREASVIASRLESKRAELAAIASQQYTFKPSIDPHSRMITIATRRATGVPTTPGGGTGMVPPTNGHPQRAFFGTARFTTVWDRLYSEAKDFEDARARAISEAVAKEIEGVTFTPVISERSRRIADAADRVLSALQSMRPKADGSPDGHGDKTGSVAQRAAVFDRLYAQALSEPEVQALREELGRRLELRDCTFQPRLLVPSAARATVLSGKRTANLTALVSPLKTTGRSGSTGRRPSETGSVQADAAPASARSTSKSRRNVYEELASQHKDYAKLEEVRARLELAHCTFTPQVDAPAAPTSARRSSGGPERSASRPADVWERIVAEVEKEAQSSDGLKLTASSAKLPTGEHAHTRSRSKSPAVFDRLYLEGVEKGSSRHSAALEAQKAARELEGCTFAPDVSDSLARADMDLSRTDGEVHDRLYREALMHEESVRMRQLAADEEARRLSELAVQMAVDPETRAQVLAEEEAKLKRTMTGTANMGKPSQSRTSPSTSRSSTNLLRATSASRSMRATASIATMSTSPAASSPAPTAPAIAIRRVEVVPEEPAIAVKAVSVVADDAPAADADSTSVGDVNAGTPAAVAMNEVAAGSSFSSGRREEGFDGAGLVSDDAAAVTLSDEEDALDAHVSQPAAAFAPVPVPVPEPAPAPAPVAAEAAIAESTGAAAAPESVEAGEVVVEEAPAAPVDDVEPAPATEEAPSDSGVATVEELEASGFM